MLSHSQLFPLLSKCLGRVGALMAENSVAAVWVTNDPKVREYSRTIDRQRRVVSAVVTRLLDECSGAHSRAVAAHAQVRAFVVAELLPSWGFEVRRPAVPQAPVS